MWLTALGFRSRLSERQRFSRMRLVCLLPAAFSVLLTGCASFFATGSPPLYYDIEYAAPAVDCLETWKTGVRVWPFSASAPYDREEMIILDADRQVRFSSAFRWVAVPGVMVADQLLRDLGEARLFGQASSSVNRLGSGVELSGHIHRFAWEDRGPESKRAVLEVEVSLWREEPKRDVIFRRSYRLESPPSRSGSSDAMAEALSGLVRELSDSLQRDLCTTRKGS